MQQRNVSLSLTSKKSHRLSESTVGSLVSIELSPSMGGDINISDESSFSTASIGSINITAKSDSTSAKSSKLSFGVYGASTLTSTYVEGKDKKKDININVQVGIEVVGIAEENEEGVQQREQDRDGDTDTIANIGIDTQSGRDTIPLFSIPSFSINSIMTDEKENENASISAVSIASPMHHN